LGAVLRNVCAVFTPFVKGVAGYEEAVLSERLDLGAGVDRFEQQPAERSDDLSRGEILSAGVEHLDRRRLGCEFCAKEEWQARLVA
jgi:hypothetical protein